MNKDDKDGLRAGDKFLLWHSDRADGSTNIAHSFVLFCSCCLEKTFVQLKHTISDTNNRSSCQSSITSEDTELGRQSMKYIFA